MSEINPYEPPTAFAEPLPASPVPDLPDGLFEAMRQTRPWVLLIGVLGFVGAGLMMLLAAGMLAVGMLDKASGKDALPAWLGLVYLPLALLYIPPSLFLYRYGSTIGQFLRSGSIDTLADAMRAQKSFWKFAGIVSICLIGLYLVGIAIAGVAGFMAAANGK